VATMWQVISRVWFRRCPRRQTHRRAHHNTSQPLPRAKNKVQQNIVRGALKSLSTRKQQ